MGAAAWNGPAALRTRTGSPRLGSPTVRRAGPAAANRSGSRPRVKRAHGPQPGRRFLGI